MVTFTFLDKSRLPSSVQIHICHETRRYNANRSMPYYIIYLVKAIAAATGYRAGPVQGGIQIFARFKYS